MQNSNSAKMNLREELCQSMTKDKHNNPILITGPQVSGQKHSKVKPSTHNFEKYSSKNWTLTAKDDGVVFSYPPRQWIYSVQSHITNNN